MNTCWSRSGSKQLRKASRAQLPHSKN